MPNETPQQFIKRLLKTAEAPVGPKMTIISCACGVDYLSVPTCPECGRKNLAWRNPR